MVGIAAETAEIYAKFRIPTLPIGDDKRPLVRGFKIDELTMRQSRAFMRNKPAADVIGVPDGRLSGIVRLDIDERGDDILREVIRRAGTPGAVTRTASDKFHLWYAYNGERRLTGRPGYRNARPWDDLKVDLCGTGGYAISPPSRFADGSEYRFEDGTILDDLLRNRSRLPKIRGLPDRAYLASPAVHLASPLQAVSNMRDGSGRNVNLFEALCKAARGLPKTLESFLNWAHDCNAKFGEPMLDSEVVRIAKSVFKYVESGQLRTGRHGALFERLQAQNLARDPYFFALLAWLKAENGPNSEFLVADSLNVAYLKWSRERFCRARRRAIDDGWIVQIRKPFPGCAALYRWGPKYADDHD
jgi:Bifunctional DNA primase/polymerase, N-terminal/Primase C terminal 1 (PriCT-1)